MIGRKTSFEAVLESFDLDTPAQWPLKGRSLPYGRLQNCMETSSPGHPESASQEDQQTDFLRQLRQEVHLIDRCLVEEAQRILKAYDRTAKPKFGTLRSLICPRIEAQQRARLAEDISWCQQYAAINRIGLQRLVEQHDRSHDSSAGAAFYKECSRPETNVGVFLKTPLLHKVRELQKVLLGPAGDKDQAVLGVLTQHSHSAASPRARVSIPSSPFKAAPQAADLRGGRHSRSGAIPAL
ncbi:g5323 [Coccomyxa viridis]|uniref:G5323 protein n=1 Tax=Coccomyxa viridis TaxID=1274662 RepID=A0ABP1FSJ7_9CHLO